MKKLVAIGTAFLLIMSAGTTTFAANTSNREEAVQVTGTEKVHHIRQFKHCVPKKSRAVDYTNATDSTICGYIDENHDGICDNGDNHCSRYVDEDNNGICDNGDIHSTQRHEGREKTHSSGHNRNGHGGRHHS